MLDPVFTELFIHQRSHRVLGRTVRPFCLWHQLLLEVIDSPLLYQDRPITPADLDRAVSICRTRFGQTDLSTRRPLRLIYHLFFGGLEKHQRAFAEYVADYSATPKYSVVPTKAQLEAPPPMPRGRPPDVFSTATAVIGWSHWGREVVWEMPIGEARSYAAAA